MTPLEILKEARARLARGWTQGAFARNAAGEPVHPRSGDAVCYCFAGVFRSLSEEGDWIRARMAAMRFLPASIELAWQWNDKRERTLADVLTVIDLGINFLERAA